MIRCEDRIADTVGESIVCQPGKLSAGGGLADSAALLEEKCDIGSSALIFQRYYPLFFHGPSAWTALATHDYESRGS
jgi:hypothetical protein